MSSASLPDHKFSADVKRKTLDLNASSFINVPQPKLLEESIVDGSILRNLRKKHSSISDSETESATCESTRLSLDNNDNADGKIAEFDNIRAMIGVDKELIMDSLNYIDEHFHLISYNLAIKSGIMTLLLLLLSNYSKESAIYNFVKNILLKKTKNLLRNFEPTFPRSKVCNNDTTDSSSVEKETTSPSFLTDSTTNFHKKTSRIYHQLNQLLRFN